MRVASWNVESIRAHLDQVLAWTSANDVDLLCMQETRADRRRFPAPAFEAAGYDVVIAGGHGGRAGVAVATRIGFDDVVVGFPGAVAPFDDERLISFTVEGMRLHTVYAPNGRKVGTPAHAEKLAWFSLLAAWIEAEGSDHDHQMLLGDLNIAPTDLDVWDASRYRRRNLTSRPERAAFDELVLRGGFDDVIRDRAGEQRVFTWWNRRSDFYESDRGWRLDHLLATPELAERIDALTIDRDERGRDGSCDHAPILITLGTTV